mmetsp:Transcript_48448/g.141179  ORF Transcript_48448/g.141179 Transcript_48448/m.141179 type:complete len:341 (-) Transcript_48448:391-1413(-)
MQANFCRRMAPPRVATPGAASRAWRWPGLGAASEASSATTPAARPDAPTVCALSREEAQGRAALAEHEAVGVGAPRADVVEVAALHRRRGPHVGNDLLEALLGSLLPMGARARRRRLRGPVLLVRQEAARRRLSGVPLHRAPPREAVNIGRFLALRVWPLSGGGPADEAASAAAAAGGVARGRAPEAALRRDLDVAGVVAPLQACGWPAAVRRHPSRPARALHVVEVVPEDSVVEARRRRSPAGGATLGPAQCLRDAGAVRSARRGLPGERTCRGRPCRFPVLVAEPVWHHALSGFLRRQLRSADIRRQAHGVPGAKPCSAGIPSDLSQVGVAAARGARH